MQLSAERFERACAFITRHARPLDARLFGYYFGNDPADAVLTELARYQNSDGGFGHGIEPDFRAPASSPMATSVGLQYAVAVGARADQPLVQAALRYLLATYDTIGDYWPMNFKAVNAAPHAPWWHVDEIKPPGESAWANPNAEIAGYLHRYTPLVPPNFLERVTQRARQNLASGAGFDGFFRYNLLCWQRAVPDLPADLREAVSNRIAATFEKYPVNEENYGEVGIFWLAPTSDSILAQRDPATVSARLDAAIGQQAEDGGWWPGWQWGQYADAWEIAKREWAGKMTVEALHTLRSFDRLS